MIKQIIIDVWTNIGNYNIEKAQALSIAKNTNHQDGTLTIHPISIVPRAELPDDMKDNYNFDTI